MYASFGQSSLVVREGDTFSITLNLTRAPANTAGVDVNFVFWDWNALPAAVQPGLPYEDFTAVSGSNHFNPGQTSRTITYTAVADGITEPTEKIQFALDMWYDDEDNMLYGGEAQPSVLLLTILDNDAPPDIVPVDVCGCDTTQPGSVTNPDPASSGGIAKPATTEPVRYFDGAVLLASTDLASSGFGLPWGQSRSWSNAPGYSAGAASGSGWVTSELPYLTPTSDGGYVAVLSGGASLYFDPDGSGGFTPRHFDLSALAYDAVAGEFVLTDTSGSRVRYYDFSGSLPAAQRGQF
jgi:hypothetical protein